MGKHPRPSTQRLRARTLASAAAIVLVAATSALAAGVQKREQPVRMAAAETTPSVASSAIVATDVLVSRTGELTRLSFALSGHVTPRAFVLADPNRVIVDLPEVDFRIDPAVGRPVPEPAPKGRATPRRPAKAAAQPESRPLAGVVASFRFGRFAPGKSRVVVDLAEAARIVRLETEASPDGQGFRLVMEFARTDAAAFAVAATEGRKASEIQTQAAVSGPAAANDARPTIVIDPGHGGIDAGAHAGADTQEKVIVFDFAKALASRLGAAGRYRIVLTRDEDIFVPLSQRVKIARDAGAALFISIHADTLSDAQSVSGATVYTVSDRASDAEAARVAENENMADALGGLESKEDVSEVSDILFDLTRRETRAYSHVFARTLVGYIKETAKLNKNPQRSAGFRVLKAPDVPSVLLELGYLSSDKDLAQLRNPEWREKAATSVARAVDSFFAGRTSVQPAKTAGGSPEPAETGVARVIH